MVLDLVVIGTAVTLGPLHNSAFILLLSSRRGVRQGLAFLLSWLANLIVVIACVMLLTGGQPPARHSAPSTAAIAAKLAIGVALVLYGAHRHRRPPRPHGPPRWTARIDNASPATAGGLAWLLQPWALVGAGCRHRHRREPLHPHRLARTDRLLSAGHAQPHRHGDVRALGTRGRGRPAERPAELAGAAPGAADRHALPARPACG